MTTTQTSPVTATNGSAWAAVLAAGIGCATLGVAVALAENCPPVLNALNWYKPVGPLCGKTIIAIVVWLVAWIILGAAWKDKTITARKVYVTTMILIAIGLIGTFPLVFDLF